MKKKHFAVILIVWGALPAAAQAVPASDRLVQARRADEAIRVDGRLDEAVWQETGAGDFRQRNPLDGKPASERTEVWVAFDEKALYVAARLHDAEPTKIVSLLGRRDDDLESDWFSFAVDPYFDRRSGFRSASTPPARSSTRPSTTTNGRTALGTVSGKARPGSTSRDGPWKCAFPTTSCAFPLATNMSGGSISSAPSSARTSRIIFRGCAKEENGFVSRFARLTGIRGIRPGRHFEAMPYTLGKLTFSPEEEGNPFRTGSDLYRQHRP